MKYWLGLFCVFCSLAATAGSLGTVSVNILNVRNRPDTQTSTIVAKLKQGETVKIVAERGDWLEIEPPAESKVYASADYLKNGVTVCELNFRTGPSVNHQSYGIFKAGTKVQILEPAHGGWVRIAPVPGMTCFVSSRFINRSAANSTGTAKNAGASERQNAANTPGLIADLPQANQQPPQPVVIQHRPTPGTQSEQYRKHLQNIRKSRTGAPRTVSLVGKLTQATRVREDYPIRYAIQTPTGDHYWLLDINPKAVADLLNRQVKISGNAYQIPNWKIPVLEVIQLSSIPDR